MSTQTTSSDSTTGTTETGDQDTGTEATGTETGTGEADGTNTGTDTTETGAPSTEGGENSGESTYNKDALLADLTGERKKRQALQTQVDTLTAAAAAAGDTATQLQSVQGKYDRLEQFLTSVGGPLSKALDSRSFSESLFNSDTDIAELVAQWHKDNPSATAAALGGGAGSTSGGKTNINDLLRAAANK